MDLKKRINGLDLINTLGIGKIIRKMGLEFSITQMEINMKVDGAKTKDMGKEHFGLPILKAN